MQSRSFGPILKVLLLTLLSSECRLSFGQVGSNAAVNSATAPLAVASTLITTQPTSQAVKLGDTATFSVTASGANLIYTWFFNGTPIPGQNGSSLRIANVKPEQVGLYYAQIIDGSGQVTAQSNVASLTIPSPDIAINLGPTNVKVALNSAAVFFVNATASGPLSYQWLHEGRIVPNATQARLVIPHTLAADAGSYTVRLTTASAGIVSQTVNLIYTTETSLKILSPPLSQGVFRGGNARLEITATGAGVLDYAWSTEDRLLPGGTGPVLSLNNVQPSDTGEYWVDVSSRADGTTLFASAALTVFWLDLAPLPDLTLPEGSPSDPTPIQLSGDPQSVELANLTVASSNPDLISPESVFFGGAAADRFMIVFVQAGASGNARLTVTATDRVQAATSEFNISVLGANTPPVISNLPQERTAVLREVQNIPFTVTDKETPSSALQVDAQVTGSGGFVQVTGTGADRVLSVTAVSAEANNLTVVVSARDTGGAITQQKLVLNLIAPPLRLRREGPELVIAYADAGAGGTIDYRYDLSPAHPWQAFGFVPIAVGNEKVVRIPLPVSNIYFRLRF